MRRHVAAAGLGLGLVIAIAANLTYAVPRGPVTIGLGVIAPLVLPVALYIRTTFTAAGFWQIATRELATLAVAGPAAAISYVHTYELVLSVHEPWILAVVAPLSSDGLAGMATLALHRMRQPKPSAQKTPTPPKQQSRRGVNPPAPAAAAPKPVEPPRPALRSVPSGGDREQRLAEIVADGGGRGRVAKEFGVTPTQARTMLETFKARQASS